MADDTLRFEEDGRLAAGDYPMTLTQLAASSLVVGPPDLLPEGLPWDAAWRAKLVENVGVLARQLWQVGITEIFLDGSFVSTRIHPNDIDGYFTCDPKRIADGSLLRELNLLDPHKCWTWQAAARRTYRPYPKPQLPMWHIYRAELWFHAGQSSGIRDAFGNELTFPSAFRQDRFDQPRGIVQLLPDTSNPDTP